MARSRPAKTSRAPVKPTGGRVVPWRGAVPVLALVLAGFLVYANSLSGPFVLDDQDSIVTNESLRQLWPIAGVLNPVRELPTAGRPVANLSFALNYAAGGTSVRGYHLTNIALHVACGLLLFGIVRRTLASLAASSRLPASPDTLAWAAALIWLVHPLQTDAVNYLTQRTELLMAACYLLTLYAAIRAREARWWLAIAIAACFAGAGSKESMATAPILVVIYDRIFLYRSSKDAWRERGPFYLALASTWILLAALMSTGPRSRSAGFATSVSVWTYLLNQAEIIVHYLRLVIWPRGLVLMYGVPRALGLHDVAPQLALLTLLGAVTIWSLVRKPALGFLGAWFFITLAPASSIVPIATEVGAERRMYLPLAALAVLGVLAAASIGRRWLGERSDSAIVRASGFGLLAVVVVALAMGTWNRNRDYASPVMLARTTMERWPTPRAEHWLGAELVDNKQLDEGIAVLEHVLPRDASANYTLGTALFRQGRFSEAIDHLREFLAHESQRIEVPTAHETIGRALTAQGRYADASLELREAMRMAPGNRALVGELADSLLSQQKFEEAIPLYRQFLQTDPTASNALTNLGIAFAALDRNDEAVGVFRRAVEADSGNSATHRNLARALIATRAWAEAERSARQALALAPNDAVAHDELGMALAGQGRVREALEELRRSLALDPADEEVRGHLAALLRDKDGIMRDR